MPQLDYFIVDVFSETALNGNPLAVVMDTHGLSGEQMLSVAREFNLSETTFVQRRAADIERREGVRVRIFTTEEELQFAGHPTLGTASVLNLTAPDTVHDCKVILAENIGPIPVCFPAAGSLFAEMTQRDPEFGPELDRVEVARLCSLDATDLDPAAVPQIVSTGAAFAIVMLNSVDALGRLRVLQEEATAWLRARGARWFYVMAPAGAAGQEQPQFRARMQFNGGEDPATGSAAGCAISYLVHRGIVASGHRVHLRQGVEILRPSDLYLSADRLDIRITNVRVAGSTVLVAKGNLFLP